MEAVAAIVLILIAVAAIAALSSGEFVAWLFQAIFETKDTTPGGGAGAATGKEALIGRRVEALSVFEPGNDRYEGWVGVGGERWQARSRSALQRGEAATVVAVDGLTLDVVAGAGD